jgi:hypothetical protein
MVDKFSGIRVETVPRLTAAYDKDGRKLEPEDLISSTANFFEELDERRPRKFKVHRSRYLTVR